MGCHDVFSHLLWSVLVECDGRLLFFRRNLRWTSREPSMEHDEEHCVLTND